MNHDDALNPPAAGEWTDASRLEVYQTCPRRYQYKYELRLTPKEPVPSPSASFGAALHAGLATIYTGEWGDDVPCPGFASEDGFCAFCRLTNGRVWKMYAAFLAEFPLELETGVYSQKLGLLLLARYLERWKADPLTPGIMGVELTFSVPLGGIPYIGRVDLLATWNGTTYVIDHKSKSRITDGFSRGFKLNAQMTGYLWAVNALLGEATLPRGLVNVLLVANNITPNSFVRFESSRTQADIAQWRDNALWILQDLAHHQAVGFFPMNTNSCFAYGRECEYFRICTSARPDETIVQFYDVKPKPTVPFGLAAEATNE